MKPLLNLHRDPVLTLLPWIMALGALVFGLSIIASITALKNSSWGADLAQDEAVVVVPWQVDKLSQKERINRVVELIIETPGLADAQIMTEEEQQSLLKPWLGDAVIPNSSDALQVTIPTLVKLKVSDTPRLDKFRVQLAQVVSDARLVLNQQGRDQSRRLTNTVLGLLGLVLALSLGSMMLVIVFATKVLLRSQAETIQTLRQLGATSVFVRKQLQYVALRIGLAGGFIAAILIVLIGLVMWFAIPSDTLARLWFDQSLIAFPVAIIAVGVFAVAAAWLGTRYRFLQSIENSENLTKV